MVGNRSTGTSLFDLLARAWSLDDAVVDTGFNHDDSAVIYRLKSGKLALVNTRDSESPKARTRIEADTGRTTIRQRKNPVPEARTLHIEVNPAIPVVRFGPQGFMVVDVDGASHHITAQGQCIVKSTPDASLPITSICSTQNGQTLAVARPSCISLHQATNMAVLAELDMDRRIECMAFSDTADTLAVWGEESLTFIDARSAKRLPVTVEGLSNITHINWNATGSHLACATDDKFFWIVDVKAGTSQKVEGYPDQVSTATFSNTGKALLTSGAFRLAGWSSDDLPHDDQAGTPLSVGKAGLVVVNTIAAHPSRSLVAAGYANGLVTITSIGTTQEMMVHKEEATEVSSLAWSSAGEHLTIGFKSGKAAVVTFPDKLFK